MSSLPANPLPHNAGPLYYRHSGKFDVSRTALAALAAIPIALLVAFLYSYAVLYIPIAGWITFLLTGGAAYALGFATAKLLHWARVRNLPLALLATLFTSAVLIWFSWVVYVYAVFKQLNHPIEFVTLVFSPQALRDLVLLINENGAWSLKGTTPTGIALWVLWTIEVSFFTIIPVWLVRKTINEKPFCESCLTWGVEKPLVALAPLSLSPSELKQRLEAKDFAILTSATEAPAGSPLFLVVSLQGCGGCDTTQTLCVDQVALSLNKKGELQQNITPIVHRLRLTPDETVAIAMAVAQIQAATASAAAAAAEESNSETSPDANPETAALDALNQSPPAPETPKP